MNFRGNNRFGDGLRYEDSIKDLVEYEDHIDLFQLPNLTAEDFGDPQFKKDYGLKCALYDGAMANGIASGDMVIALGKAGCMGSYGSGGQRLEIVSQEIDKMKAALQGKPFLVNMFSNRNADMEMKLAQLLINKEVLGMEASAYVIPSEALAYFRVRGIHEENGRIVIPHKIIAKVSREEVLEKNRFSSRCGSRGCTAESRPDYCGRSGSGTEDYYGGRDHGALCRYVRSGC